MLSQRLKEERSRKNISQRDLASILGVSQNTVASWEVGRTKPDYEMLDQLAKYFQVHTQHLLGQGIYANKEQVLKYMDWILERIDKDFKNGNGNNYFLTKPDGSEINNGEPMTLTEMIRSLPPEMQFKVLTCFVKEVIIDEETKEMSIIYYV